jgi:hypothetical protein
VDGCSIRFDISAKKKNKGIYALHKLICSSMNPYRAMDHYRLTFNVQHCFSANAVEPHNIFGLFVSWLVKIIWREKG